MLYRFGKVEIDSSVKNTDRATVGAALRTQTGDVFDADAVTKSADDMTIALAKSGEPFAQVVPRSERHPDRRLVDVIYMVTQGKRLYVERIDIHGNIRTHDEVIR